MQRSTRVWVPIVELVVGDACKLTFYFLFGDGPIFSPTLIDPSPQKKKNMHTMNTLKLENYVASPFWSFPLV
jgi:hypothetical protein